MTSPFPSTPAPEPPSSVPSSTLSARRISCSSRLPQPAQPSPASHVEASLLSFFSLYLSLLPSALLEAHSLTPPSALTLSALNSPALLHPLLHLLCPSSVSASTSTPPSLDLVRSSIEASLSSHTSSPYSLQSLLSSTTTPITLPALALLCAVYGEGREAVVGDIMGLAEEQQLGLMSLINDWSHRAGVDSIAEGAEELIDPLPSPSLSQPPSTSGSPRALPSLDTRSREGSAAGERAELEFQAMKARLEAAFRTRDAEVEMLRRQMRAQAQEAKDREEDLRAEMEKVAAERTAQLERALAEARRVDTSRQLRQVEAELTAAQEEAGAATVRLSGLQREKEKGDKERLELADGLRRVRDELLVCQQRLDDLSLVKAQLSRAQQRLELVSDLKEQYAELETECRDKADRIAQLETDADAARLSAHKLDREYRETLRLRDVEATELRLRGERAEDEAADVRAELRLLREELRRQREEAKVWDVKEVPSRSLALSIADVGTRVRRASSIQDGERSHGQGQRDAAGEEERAEWRQRLDALRREVEEERAARAKAEAMQAEWSRRCEEERARGRRLRATVREYEAMLKEGDRLRLEEELQGVREQAMMAAALYGLVDEVSTKALLQRHHLTHLPSDGEERKEEFIPP